MADETSSGGSIKQNLLKWLEKQGYPCEMRAARVFQEQGFKVRQSYYYTPEGNDQVSREGDILAVLTFDVLKKSKNGSHAIASLELGVVCECKSTDSAWVMFTRPLDEEDHRFARLHRLATDAGAALIDSAYMVSNTSQDRAIYLDPPRSGYQLQRSYSDPKERGKDVAYEAITKVTEAAVSALQRRMSRWVLRWRPCRIVLPVIVVDAPLFECFLGDDGSSVLEPASSLSLYWEKQVADRDFLAIDVVTLTALPDYVSGIVDAFEHLRTNHQREIVEVCAKRS